MQLRCCCLFVAGSVLVCEGLKGVGRGGERGAEENGRRERSEGQCEGGGIEESEVGMVNSGEGDGRVARKCLCQRRVLLCE